MISLDLPAPLSVNRTRKIDWSAQPGVRAWTKEADGLTMAAWSGGKKPKRIMGRFEATIVFSESMTGIDLDNGPKKVLDFAKRLELIVDDGPRYMRRLVVEWGEAPSGCRLTLRALD